MLKLCFNSFSTVDEYYVPDNGSLEEYVSFIKELPSTDIPEVFGQHHNAEIPHQVQTANEMIQDISKITGESFSQLCDFDEVKIYQDYFKKSFFIHSRIINYIK